MSEIAVISSDDILAALEDGPREFADLASEFGIFSDARKQWLRVLLSRLKRQKKIVRKSMKPARRGYLFEKV